MGLKASNRMGVRVGPSIPQNAQAMEETWAS